MYVTLQIFWMTSQPSGKDDDWSIDCRLGRTARHFIAFVLWLDAMPSPAAATWKHVTAIMYLGCHGHRLLALLLGEVSRVKNGKAFRMAMVRV